MLSQISIKILIFSVTKISMLSISSFGNLIMIMIFNLVGKNFPNIQDILYQEKHQKEFSHKMSRNFNIKRKWVLVILCGSFFVSKIKLQCKVSSIGLRLWILMEMESSQDMNLSTSIKSKVRGQPTWKAILTSTLKILSAKWQISSKLMEVSSLHLKIS